MLGLNGEGSAKRATAFFFTCVLLLSLTAVYEFCFYLAVMAPAPTNVHVLIVKMYEPIHFSMQLTIWMLLGLATVETITSLIRTIKGANNEQKDNQRTDS